MTGNHFKRSEQTWDAIAESFNHTRRKPWKQCLDFIEELSSSAIVADLGCGNGRHLLPCAEQCASVIGVDISSNLLRIVHAKGEDKKLKNVSLIHANLVRIPLNDNSCDAVLFIAALHNIKGKQERRRSLKEVQRILKPGGRALLSVWSKWQDAYWKHFFKEMIISSRDTEVGNIEIHWRQHQLNVPRFYHLYGKREFVNDIRAAGLTIERVTNEKLRSKTFPDNFFAIVKKEK